MSKLAKLIDMKGDNLYEGVKVARAQVLGSSPYIEICTVTQIVDGKLYLDNSKQPIRFPNRLLIIEHDPLVKMMNDYEKKNGL